jgi:hypothetical protein
MDVVDFLIMGYQLSENSLFFYVPNGAGSID